MSQEQEQQQQSANQTEQEKDVVDQLFDRIYHNNAALFDLPDIQQAFARIEEKLGKQISLDIISVFTIGLTHSAIGAIGFYDDLLKKEVNAHLKTIVDMVNNNGADIEGIKGAVTVLRRRIDELRQKVLVDDINTESGTDVVQ